MKSLIVKCSELHKEIEMLNKKGNHILLNVNEETESVENIKEAVSLVQNAEIGLYVCLNGKALSKELIDFCCEKRLILYFDIQENFNEKCLSGLANLDLVGVLSENDAERLSDEELCKIVRLDINILLKVEDGDVQRIFRICEHFLNNGFAKLFQLGCADEETEKEGVLLQTLNRHSIEQFNMEQNINIRTQMESLKRNVMKRHNRMLSTKQKEQIDVCFVNVNVVMGPLIQRKNLGIEYLASTLNLHGYHADCLYSEKLTLIPMLEGLIAENDIKVIGFSCMQDNVYVIRNAIRYFKPKYPDITYTVGGAQAIALDAEFMNESGADYIMVGESENNITGLVDFIVHKKGSIEQIDGVCYLNEQGEFIQNPRGELIANLDTIPFPNYVFKNNEELTYAGVITGRGCPFKCAFCYEGAKEKTVRYRSIDNVFEEISILLKNNKNVKIIQFYDDTFTLDVRRVKEICARMKKYYQEFGIQWICEIHCQTVYDKPELLKMMVESGLYEAQIGIESGDASILKKLNKTITPDMILQTVENCRKAGLYNLEGNLMFGAAGETKEQLEASLEFAEKLINVGRGMLQLYPVLFWPFPNTPITMNPEKYGVKIIKEQCEYTVNCISNSVSESEEVTRQEYVEHFYRLAEKMTDVYKKVTATLTAKEAAMHWGGSGFSLLYQWGRTMMNMKHMYNYFIAKDRCSADLADDSVYPVRTFDILSYRGDQLYLQEIDVTLDSFDSRILEICNGRNTIKEIAERLECDLQIIHERLAALEDRMFVFGSVI